MKKRTFVVQLIVPLNISDNEMSAYIEDAIKIHKGSLDPTDPIFELDRKSVSCKPLQKVKAQLQKILDKLCH
jgi:hypothetical protein